MNTAKHTPLCDCWDVHKNLDLDSYTCGCQCHHRPKHTPTPLRDTQRSWPCGCSTFTGRLSSTLTYCELHRAAPELVEALHALITAVEQARIESGRVDTENGHINKPGRFYPANIAVCQVTQEALDQARAAIAKAKGEQ